MSENTKVAAKANEETKVEKKNLKDRIAESKFIDKVKTGANKAKPYVIGAAATAITLLTLNRIMNSDDEDIIDIPDDAYSESPAEADDVEV